MPSQEAAKGYYSLVQYCPDPSRAEAVNVGVVLLCPERGFIDAEMNRSNHRIARLFGQGSFDSQRVNAAKEALKARLEVDREVFRSRADLEAFAKTRANDLLLTDPRPVKVWEPAAQLQDLFLELVCDPQQPEAEQPSLFRELDAILGKPRLREMVKRNQRVHVPVVDRELEVPYVVENGSINLIKPQRIGGSNWKDRAMVLAYEGAILQRHEHEDRKRRHLIVIPFAVEVAEAVNAEHQAREIFGVESIRTYSSRELRRLERDFEALTH